MTAVLQRNVLVLNRGWNPVAVVGLKKAISLVCDSYADGTPKARVLDASRDFALFTWEDWSDRINNAPKEDEAKISSSSQSFRVPEIILLSRYDKMPQQRIHFSRRTIYRRDGNQCMYCGKKPGTQLLTIDHILPRSHGGKTTWENCCLACVACNSHKANRTPSQAGMKFFISGYKPHKPKFTLYQGDVRCKSWEAVIGEAYWSVELENDNSTR